MIKKKSKGILLPISQLYGEQGIGTFGDELKHFIKLIKNCGNDYFQICPIGHTAKENSPYICYSAYAGNPLFIDHKELVKDKLLKPNEIYLKKFSSSKVEYEKLIPYTFIILKTAFCRFLPDKSYFDFCIKNAHWLDDYALFMALKEEFKNKEWHLWPKEYKFRKKSTLDNFSVTHQEKINFYKFIQFLFFKQWTQIKIFAKKIGIKIIGDIPIYISYGACDVWANPKLFILDKNLTPKFVAGVPPDYFSKTGQLWGNPLYKWQEHKKDNFKWWRNIFTHQTKLFDITRIDHFRGFIGYWRVPYGSQNAINGKWCKALGEELFTKIKKDHKAMPFIAEDLGVITKDVIKVKEKFNLFGMFITQFKMEEGFDFYNIPKKSVCYTGTHDNDTIYGWQKRLTVSQKKQISLTYNCKTNAIAKTAIDLTLSSNSILVIIPIQDYLNLGNEARINTPGSFTNIYRYRLNKKLLNTLKRTSR